MGQLDDKDARILSALYADASVSIPALSRQLGMKQSVVYSRIGRLRKRGVIERFTVEINEELLGLRGGMIVGLNIDPKQRESVLSGLEKVDEVRLITEVTGRFDAMVHLRGSSLAELNKAVYSTMGSMPGVIHAEVFTEVSRRIASPKFRLGKTVSTRTTEGPAQRWGAGRKSATPPAEVEMDAAVMRP